MVAARVKRIRKEDRGRTRPRQRRSDALLTGKTSTFPTCWQIRNTLCPIWKPEKDWRLSCHVGRAAPAGGGTDRHVLLMRRRRSRSPTSRSSSSRPSPTRRSSPSRTYACSMRSKRVPRTASAAAADRDRRRAKVITSSRVRSCSRARSLLENADRILRSRFGYSGFTTARISVRLPSMEFAAWIPRTDTKEPSMSSAELDATARVIERAGRCRCPMSVSEAYRLAIRSLSPASTCWYPDLVGVPMLRKTSLSA